MGKYQLHLLDQRKSIAEGVRFALGWALLAVLGTSTPSLSLLPAKLIPAPEGWDTGLDLSNAQGCQQRRGNDRAKDKHKGFRLPLKDDLAVNKQL